MPFLISIITMRAICIRFSESNLMPDLDQLMSGLFLVALLLYLIPAVFGVGHSAEGRRWIQRGAILTLGTAIAIAVVASVIWFAR